MQGWQSTCAYNHIASGFVVMIIFSNPAISTWKYPSALLNSGLNFHLFFYLLVPKETTWFEIKFRMSFKDTVLHSISGVCGMWFRSCCLNRRPQKSGKFLSTQSTYYKLGLAKQPRSSPDCTIYFWNFLNARKRWQKVCNRGLLMNVKKLTTIFLGKDL